MHEALEVNVAYNRNHVRAMYTQELFESVADHVHSAENGRAMEESEERESVRQQGKSMA